MFIPGFVGSKLLDDQGRTLWGDVASVLFRFDDLAFDVTPPTRVRARRVLDKFAVAGPFSLSQYDGLLTTLGNLGYSDLGYTRATTLIPFPYDWRQSNVVTARQLRELADSHPALRGRRFDIVAHSMGGLVSLLYVQNEGGGNRVRRLVTMGTPFMGSMESFFTATSGITELNRAKGVDVVRRVFTSFPSLYELLPTYQSCCYVQDGGKRRELSLSSVAMWERSGWIADVPSSYTSMRSGLAGLALIMKAAASPINANVEVFRLAGASIATRSQVLLSAVERKPVRWGFSDGDGTVWEQSAAQKDLARASVSIRRHSTIFNDQHVHEWLERLLSPRDLREFFSFAARSIRVPASSGGTLEVSAVSLTLEAQLIKVDETLRIQALTYREGGELIGGAAPPQITIHDEAGKEIQVIRLDPDGPGTFAANVSPPKVAGLYEIRWRLSDNAMEQQFFYVIQ